MSANISLLRRQARALLDEMRERGLASAENSLWKALEKFVAQGTSEEQLHLLAMDAAGAAAAATTIGLRHRFSNAATFLALHSFCRSQDCAELDDGVAIFTLPGEPAQFTHTDRLAVAARWVAYATLFKDEARSEGKTSPRAAPSNFEIGLVYEALSARVERQTAIR